MANSATSPVSSISPTFWFIGGAGDVMLLELGLVDRGQLTASARNRLPPGAARVANSLSGGAVNANKRSGTARQGNVFPGNVGGRG